MIAASAPRASACRNSTIEWPPVSSSPSQANRTLTGSAPAAASLLHVARPDLPTVLRRLAAATRPGGVLHASLKEGDGDAWSQHGAVQAPRRFTFWRAEPLREVLTAAGWQVDDVRAWTGSREQPWLTVRASRPEG